MKSPETTVYSFVWQKHAGRLMFLALNQLMSVWLSVLALVWVLSLIFIGYPALFLPYIMDVAVVSGALSGIFIGGMLIVNRPTMLSTARLLEAQVTTTAHPIVGISLELRRNKADDLVDEVHRRAADQISQMETLCAEPAQRKRCVQKAVVVGIGILTFFFVKPDLISYWKLPFASFADEELVASPGTVRVPSGAAVALRCTMPARNAAPSCRLQLTRLSGEVVRSYLLRPDEAGGFLWTIGHAEESYVYRFFAGSAVSKPETLTVVLPPSLLDLSVSLNPPGYTGLPRQKIADGQGDFSAYAGTAVSVSFLVPYLEQASIIYGQDTVSCTISGDASRGDFVVRQSGEYRIICKDSLGQQADSAGIFSVFVIEDEMPQVRFLKPRTGKDLEAAAIETLVVAASDDLGIRRCMLYWCKNGEWEEPQGKKDLSPSTPLQVVERQEVWNVNSWSLYPGDTLFFWAEVRDGAVPHAHRVSSDTLFFRFPTFREIHQKMADREKRSASLLENARASQSEIMSKVTDLDKATTRPDNRSWERQKLAESIEKDLQAQADTLSEAMKALEETIEKMKNEGQLGEDLAKKMDEIRKAVDDLIKQFGDSLLFPKNEKGEISLDDMKDAVDKLKEMLPDLSERLDNTMKYLEALKRDRELSQLSMQAEKLAQEQAMLAENASDKAAADREKELLDRVEDLQKQMKDKVGDEPLGEAASQVQSRKEELAGQMKQGGTPQKNTMRQMSGALASLAQKLQEQTAAYRMEQAEILKSKLLGLAGDFIAMAFWQESVRGQNAEDERSRREQAKEQQGINEALSLLRQGIDSLPMLPPILKKDLTSQIEAAGHSSQAAIEAMESGGAAFGMQVSAHSMRMVAQRSMEILEALSQDGSSCQGGSGMQESLKKMSGRQAAINSATSQLLRSLLEGGAQGGGKSGKGTQEGNGEGSEAARKAAQEAQAALGEELKKLGEKFGDAAGDGMKKKIEELEKEARAISKMLSAPQEEVTERQDRFLARMLQSALSMHREDEGKDDRKSTSGEQLFTTVKGTFTDSLSMIRDHFYRMRKRALQHGNYPPSYRMSINNYFDSLGTRYLRESVKGSGGQSGLPGE